MFHSYVPNYQSAMEFLCTNALGFPSCQWSSNSSSRQRRLSYHPGSADALKATVSQPKAGGFTSSSPYFPTFFPFDRIIFIEYRFMSSKTQFPHSSQHFLLILPILPTKTPSVFSASKACAAGSAWICCARRRPSVREPRREKWRPSISQSSLSLEKGSNSPAALNHGVEPWRCHEKPMQIDMVNILHL